MVYDSVFGNTAVDSSAVRLLVRTGGYAAKRIAGQLQKCGGVLVALPEGFMVEGTEGPLSPGEEERARAWAAGLLGPSEAEPAGG